MFGGPVTYRVGACVLRICVLFSSCSLALFSQTNSGELRLNVTDPSGLAVKTTIQIISEANQYRRILSTDDRGILILQRLSYGVYQLHINQQGFAEVRQYVEIGSSIPTRRSIQLRLMAQGESVTVSAANTVIDPGQAGSVNQIGSDSRQTAQFAPGRSMQDLVNSQPGWLYEGNAVLHPRGSEYQTQFVLDGIPLTDNRSPSFGPEIEADDVALDEHLYRGHSRRVRHGKLGGVVEVNTLQDPSNPVFTGRSALSGGSFDVGRSIRSRAVCLG